MIDIDKALHEHARTLDTPRGDEAYPHVSDLFGCDRETWARRKGAKFAAKPDATIRLFAMGHFVEQHIMGALPSVRQGVRIALRIAENGDVVSREIGENEKPMNGEIVGHVDGVGNNFVVEVKSTKFYKGAPTRDSVNEHYRLQAATYALALGFEHYVVVIMDRWTGEYVSYDYSVYETIYKDDERSTVDIIKDRIDDVLLFTHPSQHKPPAEPFTKWKCGYCDYRECERNKGRR